MGFKGEELKNTRKENYGLEIIKALSKKLTSKYGKGFGNASLYSYLTFYKTYQDILLTVFGESFLSWSHYLILMQVDDEKARQWYEKEALEQSWSLTILQKNVSSQRYYRHLKSQGKESARKKALEKAKDPHGERRLLHQSRVLQLHPQMLRPDRSQNREA